MSGRITVITGPMFAGKTTTLIDMLNATCWHGPVFFVRPKADTRGGISHNAQARLDERITVITRSSLCPVKGLYPGMTIGIDEGQFFPDLVAGVLEMIKHDVYVIVAGLSLDAEGRPFGQMPILLAHADEVIVRRARCVACWRPAEMTRYKGTVPKTSQILVGGDDLYEPVCRRCYYGLRAAVTEGEED